MDKTGRVPPASPLAGARWPGSWSSSPPCRSRRSRPDHLTSGGFEVPGSQSQVVSRTSTASRARSATTSPSCWRRRPGVRTPPPCARRSTASGGSPATLPHVALTPRGGRCRERQAGLRPRSPSCRSRSRATAIRPRPGGGLPRRARHGDAATASSRTSSASRRCGPACRTSPRRTSRAAERIGFPLVLIILLAVFGSLAAAALPLALGFAERRRSPARVDLLPLAGHAMSVFVTNIASMIGIGVAVGLLAVRARPLPRGDPRRAPSAPRRARVASAPPASP